MSRLIHRLFRRQPPQSNAGWIARVLVLAAGAAAAWVSLLPALLGFAEARATTDTCRLTALAAEPDGIRVLLLGFPLIATVLAVLAVFIRASGLALASVSAIVLGLGVLAVAAWWGGQCPATVVGQMAPFADLGFLAYIPVAVWLVCAGVLASMPFPGASDRRS